LQTKTYKIYVDMHTGGVW